MTITQKWPIMAKLLAKPNRRGVAQLVEHWSPKPGAAGSSPVSPAILVFNYSNQTFTLMGGGFLDGAFSLTKLFCAIVK